MTTTNKNFFPRSALLNFHYTKHLADSFSFRLTSSASFTMGWAGSNLHFKWNKSQSHLMEQAGKLLDRYLDRWLWRYRRDPTFILTSFLDGYPSLFEFQIPALVAGNKPRCFLVEFFLKKASLWTFMPIRTTFCTYLKRVSRPFKKASIVVQSPTDFFKNLKKY